MILSFTGTHVDIFPFFCTDEGKVDDIPALYSPELHNNRTLSIYIPPSLVENALPRKINILVMSDGQALELITKTLDHLIYSGFINEVIVVGIHTVEDRFYVLTPSTCKDCGGCENGNVCICKTHHAVMGASGGGLLSISCLWHCSSVDDTSNLSLRSALSEFYRVYIAPFHSREI